MLMNWASPYPGESAAPPKQKVTSTAQLESTEDELADYKPPPRPNNISKRDPLPPAPEYSVCEDPPILQVEKPRDLMLEKLNYLISLIEDQKDARTEHAMEDMILYVFLGVFTLFVLDTFVKHGRYTR